MLVIYYPSETWKKHNQLNFLFYGLDKEPQLRKGTPK